MCRAAQARTTRGRPGPTAARITPSQPTHHPDDALTPFRGSGWFSVQLSFQHPGYDRFQTNYSYLNLRTNSWKGEPALSAGDILLQPAAK